MLCKMGTPWLECRNSISQKYVAARVGRPTGSSRGGALHQVHNYLNGPMDVIFKDRLPPCMTARTLPRAGASEGDKTLDARVDAIAARQRRNLRHGKGWIGPGFPVCAAGPRGYQGRPCGVALRAILDRRPSRRSRSAITIKPHADHPCRPGLDLRFRRCAGCD
ncbi:MAG TPA: hypothetical protein VFY92_08105 [Hyphomicrobiaceae bacterium]|nr:hypothetical protein [Hyphomicrobiaceae bacterium]